MPLTAFTDSTALTDFSRFCSGFHNFRGGSLVAIGDPKNDFCWKVRADHQEPVETFFWGLRASKNYKPSLFPKIWRA
jgi:hypothetical protein